VALVKDAIDAEQTLVITTERFDFFEMQVANIFF